jgi:hypothetical protein
MEEKELRPVNPFIINLNTLLLTCSVCNESIELPEDFTVKNKDKYEKLIKSFKTNHKKCVTKYKNNGN